MKKSRVPMVCRHGHDQTLPGARGVNKTTGGTFCVQCRRDQLARYVRNGGTKRRCVACNVMFRGHARYCSKPCRRAYEARRDADKATAMEAKIQATRERTVLALELAVQMEVAMPWEREGLRQQIQAMQSRV